mgnify:CR=1 FL=1
MDKLQKPELLIPAGSLEVLKLIMAQMQSISAARIMDFVRRLGISQSKRCMRQQTMCMRMERSCM